MSQSAGEAPPLNAATEQRRRPAGRPAMRMTWSQLMMAHWRVPIEHMQALIPPPFVVDAFDGCAWLGLVPFHMSGVRVRGLPVPTTTRFLECNVRTYVRLGDERCVWFFSLDAASRLSVIGARTMWRLNYRNARMQMHQEDDRITYELQRTDRTRRAHLSQRFGPCGIHRPQLRCAWTIGDRTPPSQPGDLEHFLTERYALVSLSKGGEPLIGRIYHQPWPLRRAELHEIDDQLCAAAGFGPFVSDAPDHVICADEIDVDAWALTRHTRDSR